MQYKNNRFFTSITLIHTRKFDRRNPAHSVYIYIYLRRERGTLSDLSCFSRAKNSIRVHGTSYIRITSPPCPRRVCLAVSTATSCSGIRSRPSKLSGPFRPVYTHPYIYVYCVSTITLHNTRDDDDFGFRRTFSIITFFRYSRVESPSLKYIVNEWREKKNN